MATSKSVDLQSSSTSSATSTGSNSNKKENCDLPITSVNQTQKLLRLLRGLPQPDPRRDESCSWWDLFSLESLRLTLPQIIQDCQPQESPLWEEFPFSSHLSAFGTLVKHPKMSPSKPKAHINLNSLALKKKYLKLLIRFYENRILWLSIDSRKSFGVVRGKRVVVLIEDSAELGVVNVGQTLDCLKRQLCRLIEEQLLNKECIYLIKFGSKACPRKSFPLPFIIKRSQCKAVAEQWVGQLSGEGGCNLLDALRLAINLPSLDTICVVLHSQPDQNLGLVQDYLVDTLSGECAPRLHIVCFHGNNALQHSLADLASQTHAHFHSVEECACKGEEGKNEKRCVVEDSDIAAIKEQITRARTTLVHVHRLKQGILEDPIVEILRELSLTTDWLEDDDFPIRSRPSGDHTHPCTTKQWLKTHSTDNKGLGLYKFLAPNAYPQLSEHVKIVDRMAVSHVYDVMPVFTWHDGSIMYLHIDVKNFHHYLHTLTAHIEHTLTPRLQWLLSGSNVPFGVLTESRVVMVIDSSHPVLAGILRLQDHLKALLTEQLAHTTAFNMLSFGSQSSKLSDQFLQPSRDSLLQAWEWVLSLSPSDTPDLLSGLRAVFETESILSSEEVEDTIGVYLIVTSMPDQCTESLCSYIQQVVGGRGVTLHVVYYNMEHSDGGLVIPGREGGRYATQQQTEDCLRALAQSGRGRFHQFRISGLCEGDDSEQLLEEIRHAHHQLSTAERILNDYREFCKRNMARPGALVSVTEPEQRHPPPPTHPRQTTASLARLNAGLMKVASLSPQPLPQGKRTKTLVKTQLLYTGLGNQKVTSLDFQSHRPGKMKKILIPRKEAIISSKEWLSQYSVDKLQLSFSKLLPQSSPSRAGLAPHKHLDNQGKLVDLMVNHSELKSYVRDLQTVLNRYQARMDWLSKDCHKYFGVVIEKDAVFLLDVSSSMTIHLDSIKAGVSHMLRELPSTVKRLNIVAFSSEVVLWADKLTPVSMEIINEAILWVDSLKTRGGSSLLEAIKRALESGAEGVYLVTDGTANHTQEFLLSQLQVLRWIYGDKWRVHTVVFSRSAREFSRQLAKRTGGRFHVAMEAEANAQSMTGDDLSLLSKEIRKVQDYLKRAKAICYNQK